MTTEQSNYLDMFLAVEKFYKDNQTELDLILARKVAYDKLIAKNLLIGQVAGKQSIPGTGVTLDKQAARDLVDQLTFINISSVNAYAKTIGNNTLAEQMNYAFSTISDINDESIADWANERKDITNGILASLVDYGITATSQTAWQDAIDDYRPLIATTRNYVVEHSGHTNELDLLIIETRDHLTKVLDKLMNVYRFSNSVFFGKYKTARNIVDLGHGHSAENPVTPQSKVSGKITSSATGEGLFEVTVKLVSPGGELITTTDLQGNYLFEFNTPQAEIAANVVATKDGFIPKTTPVTVTTQEGGSFPINIQLDPLAPPPPPPMP